MDQIVALLSFDNDSFGIKYPTNVENLLNKETKRYHSKLLKLEVYECCDPFLFFLSVGDGMFCFVFLISFLTKKVKQNVEPPVLFKHM